MYNTPIYIQNFCPWKCLHPQICSGDALFDSSTGTDYIKNRNREVSVESSEKDRLIYQHFTCKSFSALAVASNFFQIGN